MWFENPRRPSGQYSSDGWEERRGTWQQEMAIASTLEDEKASDDARVRNEVSQYADGYYRSWKEYLNSLELKKARGSVSGWLEALSTTKEYEDLLRPASVAIGITDSINEPQFRPLRDRLQSLAKIPAFVDSGLPKYQTMLGEVARDLKRCEEDGSALKSYRQGVLAGDSTKSLVRARAETDNLAGMAEGSLRRLLVEPLNDAVIYLQSQDLTKTQWQQMTQVFEATSGRFPFGGEQADKPVEVGDLQALLGWKSGSIPDLRSAASDRMSPVGRKWVDEVASLTPLFFEDQRDELRPFPLRVTLGEPVYAPADLKEEYPLKTVKLYLGEGADQEWDAQKPESRTKMFQIELFGARAGRESFLNIAFKERRGLLKRTLGGDYKDLEPKRAESRNGNWASLKLLAAGLPGGSPGSDQDVLSLTYVVNLDEEEKNPKKMKKVTITIKAEGPGLGRLLKLMKEGLPEPPDAGKALVGG